MAGAQSAVANAITSMAMSRALAAPTRRRLMRAAKVERKAALKAALKAARKVALRVAQKAALRVGTSAGQIAARASTTPCKRVPLPTRRTALPTTQHRSVIQGPHFRISMKATARLKQARMPMATRGVKNVHGTVMAVTVVRAASVRTAVIALNAVSAVSEVSARTVRRRTASSHWRALRVIQGGQIRCQNP